MLTRLMPCLDKYMTVLHCIYILSLIYIKFKRRIILVRCTKSSVKIKVLFKATLLTIFTTSGKISTFSFTYQRVGIYTMPIFPGKRYKVSVSSA